MAPVMLGAGERQELLLAMLCVSTYLWKEKGIAEAQVVTQQQQVQIALE